MRILYMFSLNDLKKLNKSKVTIAKWLHSCIVAHITA